MSLHLRYALSLVMLQEVLQGYALTETTATGAYLDGEEESRHYGSIGMLAPNTEAKIIDPDSGTPLPPNKRGELWLRGPIVMKGMCFLNNLSFIK